MTKNLFRLLYNFYNSRVSAGSSTACIVILDRQSHRLHTANLGDSGFLVVRGGEVVHRSDEQQHYFNTPFQLSIAPPGAEGAVLSDRYDVWPDTALRAGGTAWASLFFFLFFFSRDYLV